MEEKLLRMSLVIAVIGIISLFCLLQIIGQDVEGKGIADSQVRENQIKFIGIVEDLSSYEEVTFLTISRIETLEIIAFDNVTIEKGARVEVIGTISEQEGNKEVIASRIRVF
ncbi:MAG: hypothetical protein U9R34_04585 [Nanoarchaeota archaeon]|nr:hypothetical protein [Nanoarchaeota archaeon]